MLVVLVDKLLKTQVVECSAVATWIFSKEMNCDFTKMYLWEILHLTIKKMNKHVIKLGKRFNSYLSNCSLRLILFLFLFSFIKERNWPKPKINYRVWNHRQVIQKMMEQTNERKSKLVRNQRKKWLKKWKRNLKRLMLIKSVYFWLCSSVLSWFCRSIWCVVIQTAKILTPTGIVGPSADCNKFSYW